MEPRFWVYVERCGSGYPVPSWEVEHPFRIDCTTILHQLPAVAGCGISKWFSHPSLHGDRQRAIAAKLEIPVMTTVEAYKTFNTENGTCTETATPKNALPPRKGRPRKLA
jgi:hypothetical protein